MFTNQTRSTIACAVILLVQADVAFAASNNKGKLEGTKWESKAATFDGVAVPAGIIKLDFSKNENLLFRIADKIYKGTYELGEGDEVTFSFEEELDGEKVHVETITIRSDTLIVIDDDGVSISFDRAKR